MFKTDQHTGKRVAGFVRIMFCICAPGILLNFNPFRGLYRLVFEDFGCQYGMDSCEIEFIVFDIKIYAILFFICWLYFLCFYIHKKRELIVSIWMVLEFIVFTGTYFWLYFAFLQESLVDFSTRVVDFDGLRILGTLLAITVFISWPFLMECRSRIRGSTKTMQKGSQ